MMKTLPTVARWTTVALLGASLGACALNEKIDEATRIDYRSAGKLPSLEVPPDLTSPRSDNRFAIPEGTGAERTYSAFERSRSGAAPGAGDGVARARDVLPQVAGARIVREGNQRWLVVDAPPEKVWPVVRDFWPASGFVVKSESPDTGILETEWAENQAKLPLDFIRRTVGRAFDNLYSTGERDKFRTRLEPVGASTEVYISHRGMVEVFTSQAEERTVWQPRPSDPDLEAEFLRRLMLRFVPDSAATQTALADAPAASERARLINTSTVQQVEVGEGFDRAWRRVGLALDRGGFTVEDRDRTKGLYFVRYIDPEIEGGRVAQKPGFLKRIFGSAKARADASQQFRIEVSGGADKTKVSVLGPDGGEVADVDRPTAGRILALLHEQLK